MNNYQSSIITLSILEESAAQARHLSTLQTLESLVKHSDEPFKHIYENCLKILREGY